MRAKYSLYERYDPCPSHDFFKCVTAAKAAVELEAIARRIRNPQVIVHQSEAISEFATVLEQLLHEKQFTIMDPQHPSRYGFYIKKVFELVFAYIAPDRSLDTIADIQALGYEYAARIRHVGAHPYDQYEEDMIRHVMLFSITYTQMALTVSRA